MGVLKETAKNTVVCVNCYGISGEHKYIDVNFCDDARTVFSSTYAGHLKVTYLSPLQKALIGAQVLFLVVQGVTSWMASQI